MRFISHFCIVLLLISLFLYHINGQNDGEEKDSESEDETEEEDYEESGESDGEVEVSTTTTTTTTKKPSRKRTKSTKSTSTTVMPTTITTTTTSTTTTPKPISNTKPISSIEINSEKMTTTTDSSDDDYEEDKEGNKSEEKTEESHKQIEREEVADEEDDEDYEEEGGGDNDYYTELTREELLKGLINRYSSSPSDATEVSSNLTVNQKWIQMLSLFDKEINSMVRAITPVALDAFYEIDLSPSCSNSLLRLSTGLQQSQQWAFSMLDSNGRFPIGLMSGTLSSLGAYDQCLETKAIEDDTELFRGQYCILQTRPPLPQTKGRISYKRPLISLKGSKFENTWLDTRIAGRYATGFYSVHIYNGLCLPSTCSATELKAVAKRYIGDYLDVDIDYCDTKTDKDFFNQINGSQRIAFSIVGISLIMVIIATIIETLFPEFVNFRSFGRLIVCFSIISNVKKLFTIDKQKVDQSLQFVHGLRVITMIWIIAIHTFTVGTLFVPMLVYRFEDEARKFGQQLSTQFIFNGYISVSIFFFLSGLVVTYITFPVLAQNRGPGFVKYVSIRWLRFIPPLIGTICLHILWPLFGSGPVFKQMASELTTPCVKNWWTNILLINNWLILPEMCMVHTWFLSADFQLHIISFFVLFFLSRKQSFGILVIIALIITGIAVPFFKAYTTDAPPIPMPFEEPKLDQFYKDLNVQYHPTYNHLSTYFIGVLVGFLLSHKKDSLKFAIHWKIILWTILPLISCFSVFATYLWTGLELDYNRVIAGTYSGFHRISFILLFAWIAIHCSTSEKNFISRILSSNAFIPFSRLSFSVYLVHILVVWYFVLQSRSLIRFSFRDFIFSTGGIILYSLAFALLLHLLFESVWVNIINLVFKKRKIDDNNNNGQTLQNMNGKNDPEISINQHFMKAAIRSEKNKPNGHIDRNGTDYFVQSVRSGNIYVEVGDSCHMNGCPNDCHCIKNTQL